MVFRCCQCLKKIGNLLHSSSSCTISERQIFQMGHQFTGHRLFQIFLQYRIFSFSVITIFRKIIKPVFQHTIFHIKMHDMMFHITGPDVFRYIFDKRTTSSGTNQRDIIHHILKSGMYMTTQEVFYFFFPWCISFF